ncbi:MAG: Sulfate transport system permease protein CysW [Pseudomonadota bacterium]|jgi:tungstate transport system permease protein
MNSLTESLAQAFGLILHLDAGLLEIVGRSLYVSLVATLLAVFIGAALGSLLAVWSSRLKPTAVVILNTYVAIPAVVVGLVVYILLSRSGPLGSLGWLFTVPAMILAQTVLVIPLAATMTRQIIEDAHQSLGDRLRSLGAGRGLVGLLLLFNERHAMVTVLVTCFGRAISEVGTVMMVGGNIDGFTRVMTTTIALETSKGDLPLAIGLGIVLLLVVLILNMVLAGLRALQPRDHPAL